MRRIIKRFIVYGSEICCNYFYESINNKSAINIERYLNKKKVHFRRTTDHKTHNISHVRHTILEYYVRNDMRTDCARTQVDDLFSLQYNIIHV